jgi:hypothetical protein
MFFARKKSASTVFKLKVNKYFDKNGNFDYNKYKEIQTAGNKKKIENTWVIEGNIRYLSDIIKKRNLSPQFGLCHGTRRGLEQQWFEKYLKCKVIGTEISDTANDFPNTIQWDFHEIKDEWVGNVDFIYSNSLDHSYDPEKCLSKWMKCLSPKGLCIIEHSDYHGVKKANNLDPFGAELVIMPYLILKWGNGNYSVREIIEAPHKKEYTKELKFLISMNNQRHD